MVCTLSPGGCHPEPRLFKIDKSSGRVWRYFVEIDESNNETEKWIEVDPLIIRRGEK